MKGFKQGSDTSRWPLRETTLMATQSMELRCEDQLQEDGCGGYYISSGKKQWGLEYDMWSGLDIQGEM